MISIQYYEKWDLKQRPFFVPIQEEHQESQKS